MAQNNPLQIMKDKYRRDRPPSKAMTKPKYAAYLKTPEWKRKRDLVHKRAKNICEGCGMVKSKEVHHLSYTPCRKRVSI